MSIVMIYHGIKTEFRNHGKRESFEYFISIIREKAKCVLLEEGVNLDSQTQKFARRYEGEREGFEKFWNSGFCFLVKRGSIVVLVLHE